MLPKWAQVGRDDEMRSEDLSALSEAAGAESVGYTGKGSEPVESGEVRLVVENADVDSAGRRGRLEPGSAPGADQADLGVWSEAAQGELFDRFGEWSCRGDGGWKRR